MVALSLEFAKNLAIVIAIAFAVLAIASTWVVKNVTSKVITVLILAGLALGVWTQRQNLQDCADKVRAREALGAVSEESCTFFGSEVNLP